LNDHFRGNQYLCHVCRLVSRPFGWREDAMPSTAAKFSPQLAGSEMV
jgi:hypothetical protein